MFWSKQRVWKQESRKKSLPIPHAMRDGVKKDFFRAWWRITSEWVDTPKRTKPLSVLPPTIYNVRSYLLFRWVIKMNTE